MRGNAWDNRALVGRLVVLRAERAVLLGYRSHSDYVLADRTAQTNANLDAMLRQLFPAAIRNARREEIDLAAAMAADLGDSNDQPFAAWDWSFYAQAVKRERYDFDGATLRPYFELDRTLVSGVFYAAERLYGITFSRRDDLVAHHEEAAVYEVHNADGSSVGLFVADYFTRDSKRGGAWMSAMVTQSGLLDSQPVVLNIMNVPKPPPGELALLNLDEVGTMFHEFGHASHGLFSLVRYPRLAGTAVAKDCVEYPSQVNEMWMTWPSVLEHYTSHVETGQPLPATLVARMDEAVRFNEGFNTVAYLAAAWIDLSWHWLSVAEAKIAGADIDAFERRALQEVGGHRHNSTPIPEQLFQSHLRRGLLLGLLLLYLERSPRCRHGGVVH